MTPRAAARVFTGSYSEKAVIEIAGSLRENLRSNASLGFVYFTREWRPYLDDRLELIRLHARVPQLVGCSGYGVIGNRRELEREQSLSLVLRPLPNDSFSGVASSK